MKAPIVLLYLRSLGRLGKRARSAEFERDDALALVTDLREDLDELQEEHDAWKRRAEALYDACDPDIRDGVLGVIDTIERLAEVER